MLAAAALAFCASSASAQSFSPPDVHAFQVVGADRGVLNFPVTARLTTFRVEPGAMTIHTTGAESWPAVDIDGSGPSQAATLWVAERIAGVWYATGAERLRPGQINGPKPEAEGPGALATLIGSDWLYDSSRWRPMAGYNPAFGEPVCVMVAAGSTRSDNQTPVQARTQWLCLSWPNGTTLWQEGDAVQPPSDPPVIVPPVVVPPKPPTVDPPANNPTLDELNKKLDDLKAQVQGVDDRLKKHDEDPTVVRKFFANRYTQMIMAALGAYITQQQVAK